MERSSRPRRRHETPTTPSSLHEITRRYVATALALSKAMGLPWTEEFIRQHRESISTCFIAADRAGVKLASTVQLPPLGAPLTPDHGQPEGPGFNTDPPLLQGEGQEVVVTPIDQAPTAAAMGNTPKNSSPPPLIVPADSGLPCGGVAIAALKPAQLSMLIGKTARLVHDEGEGWVPLLASLQGERGRRLEAGRRPQVNGQG